MALSLFVRRILVGLAVLAIVPCALARQKGQSGSTNKSAGSGLSTTTSEQARTNPGTDSQSQIRRQPLLYISGAVILEDGSPPPMGVVLERICGTSVTKVAYVASNGSFSFEAEANDALNSASWSPLGNPFGSTFGAGPGAASKINGCELRAALAGYRSSQVTLSASQTTGDIDIGTIVMYPSTRVPGTTVSVTSLAAPKAAKKALARAEKAAEKKNLGEAETDLKAALTAYPSYAAAWYDLGQIYEQSGRIEDAQNAFSKALQADGYFVNPYVELARLAGRESKWQLAADLTAHALEIDPIDLPEGYFINCVANYNLDNYDAAERSARKLEPLDSARRFLQAHLVRANIYRHKRDSAAEAAQLRVYLKYAPRGANADQARSRLQELEGANPGQEPVCGT